VFSLGDVSVKDVCKKWLQEREIDVILHVGLASPEMTIKALRFLDNLEKVSRAADKGFGT